MKDYIYNKVKLAGIISCFLLLASLVIISCDNDEYLYKASTDTIWLSGDPAQEAKEDSVLYSFKIYSSDVREQTMNLIVNLTGEVADHDRSFMLEVVPEETNVTPDDYEIGPTILPAGKYKVTVPIKVKRTAKNVDLARTAAKLTLRVATTDELGIGRSERAKYSIMWCNYLIRPASWDNIQFYIGPFSQARFKFIIDFTGFTDFNDFYRDYNRIIGFQGLLLKLLEKYNNDPANAGREEGWPYMNDNGEPLQFGEGLQA